MNLIQDAEDAVTGRAWAKIGLAVGIGIIVIVLLWIAIHRIFFADREAKQQHGNDVVKGEISDATAEGAAKAMETMRQVHDDYHRIDIVTRRNDDAITHAQGADTAAPDVARALHDALCLRDAYRGEPDCAGVQPPPEGVRTPETDAGSLPPNG